MSRFSVIRTRDASKYQKVMTKRKYNAVRRNCALGDFPNTFGDLIKVVEEYLGDIAVKMTAKQLAAIIELCYDQHIDGQYYAIKNCL